MSWHAKKTYINGKVVHPRGGTILLETKRIDVPAEVKELRGEGLKWDALERLEALRPRELGIPKRKNIRF